MAREAALAAGAKVEKALKAEEKATAKAGALMAYASAV